MRHTGDKVGRVGSCLRLWRGIRGQNVWMKQIRCLSAWLQLIQYIEKCSCVEGETVSDWCRGGVQGAIK